MPWAAAIAAAGAVGGAMISSDASRSAANTQADAAKQSSQTAANAQLQALGMVQQVEAPYVQAGQQALGQYQNLLSGGAANFDLSKLPGYQFQMDQGTKAIENSAAARGTQLSGNTLRDLQSYGQGLASQNFQQYLSQLGGLANMGQAAASGQANLGSNLLSGAGASLASGQMGAGIAGAAGTIGQANAWGGALTGLSSNPQFVNTLGSLFSRPTVDSPLGAGGGAAGGMATVDPTTGLTAF